MSIDFGREICGTLSSAESREWLVTNGIGGYASGTVAGLLTRRYHGLLVAALNPPLGRTLLLTKLDEVAAYADCSYPLHTNRWSDGSVDPHGYRQIEEFTLEGTIPTWRFACADALLEKRIWMQQGANTTYVRYTLIRATQPLQLKIDALVNYRDYHGITQTDDWMMSVEPFDRGMRVTANPGAMPLYLSSDVAVATPTHNWYYNFQLAVERYRGLSDRENHFHAATFALKLDPGRSVTFVASTEAINLDGDTALQLRRAADRNSIDLWQATRPPNSHTPNWIDQLVLAADQFIVDRPVPGSPSGKTIIAGYHWFGDWGRDTMISLPGVAITTGKPAIARSILRTFAKYVERGMLPNRFPDAGELPEYNTVDATLWYFEAVNSYYAATQDDELIRELFPVLAEIIDWHCRGTRYNIQLDETDGLLSAGEVGVQLTWMDAKVGDWVVTPRIGKPIEINALWYCALRTMAKLARQLGKSAEYYNSIADRTLASFSRFWNPTTGCCYDILNSPDGNDATLRPNQILAVSLPGSSANGHAPLLTPIQQRGVVDVCGRLLLTSQGLRSLAPNDPRYQGHYGGDRLARDGAYHQGTTWGWLIGAFAIAHLRVYENPAQARQFLEPFAHHLSAHGLGTCSEIFDGDAPMTPRGCIAQAWTVAEVLRAWVAIEEY
jgi:predicted glycogen debranching enzyme